MTNRERVIESLKFNKVDKVPYSISFNMQALKNLQDYTGNMDYKSTIGDHITSAFLNMPQTNIKPDFDVDDFGVIWNKTGADKDIGVIENIQISDEDDLERYVFPEIDEKFIRSQMEWLQNSDNTNFKVAGYGFSLFERAWTLMGMEDTLCNMIAEPELMHKLLDEICTRNLKILDIALEYDFDCFHFGDDWGQQKGLIMGVSHWREFIKPYLSKMYAKIKSAGRYISQHSCGDLREIMDDLYEIGLNMYQTFQPEIYGLDYAKKLKGKIAIWGAISTQADLPYIKPEQVKDLVETTKKAFDYTGLVISPTHSVEFDVPPENLVALVEAFKGE